MASLPNVFVSYQNVSPKTTTRTSKTASVDRSSMLERAKREAAKASKKKSEEDSDEEESNEEESSQKHTFATYTEQQSDTEKQNKTSNDDWLTAAYDTYYAPATATTLDLYTKRGSKGVSQKDIEDLFARNGINIKVTSGWREPGEAGNAGDNSHHVTGDAYDIVPGAGSTFDDIRMAMISSPEITRFFSEHGLGVLDETDPKVKQKTGATGDHFHIGPDELALDNWAKWTGTTAIAKHGGKFANIRDLYGQSFSQYRR